MEKRPNLSDRYQYKIVEIQHDFSPGAPDYLFDTTRSISYIVEQSEAAKDQESVVIDLLYTLPQFTKQQKIVLDLMMIGLTQQEVADQLDLNQSSIQKYLQGTSAFHKGNVHSYGGIVKKAKKQLMFSEPFRQQVYLLHQLNENSKVCRYLAHWFDCYDDFLDWMETEIHPVISAPMYLVEIGLKILKRVYSHYVNLPPRRLPYSLTPEITEESDHTISYTLFNDIFVHYYQELKGCLLPAGTKIKNHITIITDEQKKELKKDYQDGMSYKKMVEKYKVTATCITSHLRRMKLPPNRHSLPRKSRMLLTPQQISELLNDYKNHVPPSVIATKFNVEVSSIQRIRRKNNIPANQKHKSGKGSA